MQHICNTFVVGPVARTSCSTAVAAVNQSVGFNPRDWLGRQAIPLMMQHGSYMAEQAGNCCQHAEDLNLYTITDATCICTLLEIEVDMLLILHYSIYCIQANALLTVTIV